MTNGKNGHTFEELYLLPYKIDARRARMLFLILLTVLAATGCGGDDGGGGGGGY
jgi:hypothetical protein